MLAVGHAFGLTRPSGSLQLATGDGRELDGIAYDRELARELSALDNDFTRWRRGELDAHGLSHRIHEFHQGPSQRLISIYTGGALEMAVAAAIARGTLTEEEATSEIVDLLSGLIELTRDELASDRSKEPSGVTEQICLARRSP